MVESSLPTCATCGARLKKWPGGECGERGYQGDETFCSLRCGYEFGRAAEIVLAPRIEGNVARNPYAVARAEVQEILARMRAK